jgi:hypothetical protein
MIVMTSLITSLQLIVLDMISIYEFWILITISFILFSIGILFLSWLV